MSLIKNAAGALPMYSPFTTQHVPVSYRPCPANPPCCGDGPTWVLGVGRPEKATLHPKSSLFPYSDAYMQLVYGWVVMSIKREEEVDISDASPGGGPGHSGSLTSLILCSRGSSQSLFTSQ